MDVYMTDEERAEMEAEGMAMPGSSAPAEPAVAGTPPVAAAGVHTEPLASKTSTDGVQGDVPITGRTGTGTGTPRPAGTRTSMPDGHNGHVTLHGGDSSTLPSGVASGSTTPVGGAAAKKDSMKPPSKTKLTPEQRAKLAALDAEKEKARQER
jgi:hypothetical protein